MKKKNIIKLSALSIFSVTILACYAYTKNPNKRNTSDMQKVYSIGDTEEYSPVIKIDDAPTDSNFKYCIIGNETGIYMYKITDSDSELIVSDTDISYSSLPSSDKLELENGIEYNTLDEARMMWECFTS